MLILNPPHRIHGGVRACSVYRAVSMRRLDTFTFGTVEKALQHKRFRNKDLTDSKWINEYADKFLDFYTAERAPQRKPPTVAFARASLSII